MKSCSLHFAIVLSLADSFLNIADKRASAIALGHPKENTIEFLKEVLPNNQVEVVPLSELIK